MQYGYEFRGERLRPLPIELNTPDYPHALIIGASGSGKSYAMKYLLGKCLQSDPDMTIYLLDFKASDDFSFLSGYPHLYMGTNCYEGLKAYYEEFCSARDDFNKRKTGRKLLIVDEYPALISYFTGMDKANKTKKASELMGIVAELLMMGRGLGFGIWVVCQRPDASLFSGGARDNFMVTIALGRLSQEAKKMVFPDYADQIPVKPLKRGEGYILSDGNELKKIIIPRIINMPNWEHNIKKIIFKT